MKFALSVWIVALSCCVQASNSRRAIPALQPDSRRPNASVSYSPPVGSLAEISNASKGEARDVALSTNITPSVSQPHTQVLNNITAAATPRQDFAKWKPLKSRHNAKKGKPRDAALKTDAPSATSQSPTQVLSKVAMVPRLRQDFSTLLSQKTRPNAGEEKAIVKTNATPAVSQSHTQVSSNVKLVPSLGHDFSKAVATLRSRRNARKGKARVKTNATPAVSRSHTQVLSNVTGLTRPGQQQPNSTALLEGKVGKEQSNSEAPLGVHHSDVVNIDKKSKDKRDKAQSNSTALLEGLDGNVGDDGKAVKKIEEKSGNKEDAEESTLSLSPAEEIHPAKWIVGGLLLLSCCFCCLCAEIIFSHKEQLDTEETQEDDADVEAEGSRRQPIKDMIAKGKKARGVTDDDKYKFGDITRGLLRKSLGPN